MSDRSGALAAAELSAEKEGQSWRRGEEHWHGAHPTEGPAASGPLVQPPQKVFKKKALHLKNKKAMSDCRDSNPPDSTAAFKMPYKVTHACAKPISQMPEHHRITELQNGGGWKGPLWVI